MTVQESKKVESIKGNRFSIKAKSLSQNFVTRSVIGFCTRHHNPLRQRGIGPSLTFRVVIDVKRTYSNPCKILEGISKPIFTTRSVSEGLQIQRLGPSLTLRVAVLKGPLVSEGIPLTFPHECFGLRYPDRVLE